MFFLDPQIKEIGPIAKYLRSLYPRHSLLLIKIIFTEIHFISSKETPGMKIRLQHLKSVEYVG